MTKPTNSICQVCSAPFEKKEVVIQFTRWDNDPEGPMWSHLDCVYYLSVTETRAQHPPKVP